MVMHLRKTIASETLHLAELSQLIGKTVEITVEEVMEKSAEENSRTESTSETLVEFGQRIAGATGIAEGESVLGIAVFGSGVAGGGLFGGHGKAP